jgi:hypothetical protein
MILSSDYTPSPLPQNNEKNNTLSTMRSDYPLQPLHPFGPTNPMDPWNRRPIPQRLITTPQSGIERWI